MSILSFKTDFEHLSRLSMLTFSQEEESRLSSDIQSVIVFADTISNAVSEKNTDSFSCTPLREDETDASYKRDSILKNAPTQEDGYFKIPKRSEDT